MFGYAKNNTYICSRLEYVIMTEYTIQDIDKQINEILDGTKDIPKFNKSEYAGVCSACSFYNGALLVCDIAREGLIASRDAGSCQATPANREIDEVQEMCSFLC